MGQKELVSRIAELKSLLEKIKEADIENYMSKGEFGLPVELRQQLVESLQH